NAASAADPPGTPRWLATLLRAQPWVRFVPLAAAAILLLVLLIVGGVAAVIAGIVLAAAGVAAFVYLTNVLARLRRADPLYEAGQTAGGVASLPASPDFTISRPGGTVTPATGATDSAEAARFKAGLTDSARLRDAARRAAAEPRREPLDVTAVSADVVAAINPDVTIPRRVLNGISLPGRFTTIVAEEFR